MRLIKNKVIQIVLVALFLTALPFGAAPAHAETCGSGKGAVETSISFGCKGSACLAKNCTALVDVSFAIIRFLSNGVGLIIVGSLIVAGIQYSSSRGDPKASELAQQRIQSALIALLIFIFSYAILNYVIPTGFFR